MEKGDTGKSPEVLDWHWREYDVYRSYAQFPDLAPKYHSPVKGTRDL